MNSLFGSAAQTKYKELVVAHEGLQARMDALNNSRVDDYEDMEMELAREQHRFLMLKMENDELHGRLRAAEDAVAAGARKVDAVVARRAETEAVADELEARLAVAERDASSRMQHLTRLYEDAKTRAEEVETDNARLERALADLQKEMDRLPRSDEAAVAATSHDLFVSGVRLDQVEGKLEAAVTERDTANAEVLRLRGELGSLRERAAGLEERLATAIAETEAAKARAAELDSQIQEERIDAERARGAQEQNVAVLEERVRKLGLALSVERQVGKSAGSSNPAENGGAAPRLASPSGGRGGGGGGGGGGGVGGSATPEVVAVSLVPAKDGSGGEGGSAGPQPSAPQPPLLPTMPSARDAEAEEALAADVARLRRKMGLQRAAYEDQLESLRVQVRREIKGAREARDESEKNIIAAANLERALRAERKRSAGLEAELESTRKEATRTQRRLEAELQASADAMAILAGKHEGLAGRHQDATAELAELRRDHKQGLAELRSQLKAERVRANRAEEALAEKNQAAAGSLRHVEMVSESAQARASALEAKARASKAEHDDLLHQLRAAEQNAAAWEEVAREERAGRKETELRRREAVALAREHAQRADGLEEDLIQTRAQQDADLATLEETNSVLYDRLARANREAQLEIDRAIEVGDHLASADGSRVSSVSSPGSGRRRRRRRSSRSSPSRNAAPVSSPSRIPRPSGSRTPAPGDVKRLTSGSVLDSFGDAERNLLLDSLGGSGAGGGSGGGGGGGGGGEPGP